MARLTSDFWVKAYLTRLRLSEIPAFVVTHGDDTAGAVLIKMNKLDGQATLYQRQYDLMSDTRSWNVLHQGDETTVNDMIARQQSSDPDLWVIEVEDRQGRHLLGEPGLE